MPARGVILLFLALLAVAPAAARVHRRSVGPVILDLGPLPPAPVPPGGPQTPTESGDRPAVPQIDARPEMREQIAQPVEVRPAYPSHAQLLGALVLTLHAETARADRRSSSILSTRSQPERPILVDYHHPTLAADQALLAPGLETRPPSADSQSGPEVAAGADAGPQTPLPRLRGLVLWIWRVLFVIGLGAMFLLLRRYRGGARKAAAPAPTPDAGSETQPTPDVALSRALRTPRATPASYADSLSLMTGKPTAIDTPETESKRFGLIEPGAARPAVSGAETPPVRQRPQRQSPV